MIWSKCNDRENDFLFGDGGKVFVIIDIFFLLEVMSNDFGFFIGFWFYGESDVIVKVGWWLLCLIWYLL